MVIPAPAIRFDDAKNPVTSIFAPIERVNVAVSPDTDPPVSTPSAVPPPPAKLKTVPPIPIVASVSVAVPGGFAMTQSSARMIIIRRCC